MRIVVPKVWLTSVNAVSSSVAELESSAPVGSSAKMILGLATNALHDSWLGKYIKRMDWYDAGDGSTEDVLAEIRSFDDKYGK